MKIGQIKLLDFGAARLTVFDDENSLSVILKPGYAPIEQYSRKGRQGPWTDIYALSATMYYMLTRYSPVGTTDRAIGEKLEFPESIPKEIEKILENALSLKWEVRHQTIVEFKEDIENNLLKIVKERKHPVKKRLLNKKDEKSNFNILPNFKVYNKKHLINS